MFQSWRFAQIKNLTAIVEDFKYTKSQSVFQEGDLSDFVYIIKHGDFMVTQSLWCHDFGFITFLDCTLPLLLASSCSCSVPLSGSIAS